MASKVLGEVPRALLLAQDLKRTLAGRSFIVCNFESSAIESILQSFLPGWLTLSTWFSLIIRLIVSPSRILGIIQPSIFCRGMLLLLYALEVLMDFPGVFPYVCVVTSAISETHSFWT